MLDLKKTRDQLDHDLRVLVNAVSADDIPEASWFERREDLITAYEQVYLLENTDPTLFEVLNNLIDQYGYRGVEVTLASFKALDAYYE